MPTSREIAVAMLVKGARPGGRWLTTKEVTESIYQIFRFQKPVGRRETKKTYNMLYIKNRTGLVSTKKSEGKKHESLWQLTNSAEQYAEWCYNKMKEEGEI